MIEEELRTLRLGASADGPRFRILEFARQARRDSRFGQWITRTAAAAVLGAVLTASFMENRRSNGRERPNLESDRLTALTVSPLPPLRGVPWNP